MAPRPRYRSTPQKRQRPPWPRRTTLGCASQRTRTVRAGCAWLRRRGSTRSSTRPSLTSEPCASSKSAMSPSFPRFSWCSRFSTTWMRSIRSSSSARARSPRVTARVFGWRTRQACGSRPPQPRERRSPDTTASRWSRCSSRNAAYRRRKPWSPRRVARPRLSASRKPVTSARSAQGSARARLAEKRVRARSRCSLDRLACLLAAKPDRAMLLEDSASSLQELGRSADGHKRFASIDRGLVALVLTALEELRPTREGSYGREREDQRRRPDNDGEDVLRDRVTADEHKDKSHQRADDRPDDCARRAERTRSLARLAHVLGDNTDVVGRDPRRIQSRGRKDRALVIRESRDEGLLLELLFDVPHRSRCRAELVPSPGGCISGPPPRAMSQARPRPLSARSRPYRCRRTRRRDRWEIRADSASRRRALRRDRPDVRGRAGEASVPGRSLREPAARAPSRGCPVRARPRRRRVARRERGPPRSRSSPRTAPTGDTRRRNREGREPRARAIRRCR